MSQITKREEVSIRSRFGINIKDDSRLIAKSAVSC